MRNIINIVENPEYLNEWREVEFVCINPYTNGSKPEFVSALYSDLKTIQMTKTYRQDFFEEAGHWSMATIIMTGEVWLYKQILRDIRNLAKKHKVKIDCINSISDNRIHTLSADKTMVDISTNINGNVNYQRIGGILPPETVAQLLIMQTERDRV